MRRHRYGGTNPAGKRQHPQPLGGPARGAEGSTIYRTSGGRERTGADVWTITSTKAGADISQRIVVVTGAPGAGKSTLSKRLAAAMGLPVLSLDAIKESLHDALGESAADPARLRFAAEAIPQKQRLSQKFQSGHFTAPRIARFRCANRRL